MKFVGSDAVILVTGLIHTAEAAIFIAASQPTGAIGLPGLLATFGGSSYAAAAALFTAALCGMIGQWHGGLTPRWRFALMVPQQTLLLITALNVVNFVMYGTLIGGRTFPSELICNQPGGHIPPALVIMPLLYALAMPMLYSLAALAALDRQFQDI